MRTFHYILLLSLLQTYCVAENQFRNEHECFYQWNDNSRQTRSRLCIFPNCYVQLDCECPSANQKASSVNEFPFDVCNLNRARQRYSPELLKRPLGIRAYRTTCCVDEVGQATCPVPKDGCKTKERYVNCHRYLMKDEWNEPANQEAAVSNECPIGTWDFRKSMAESRAEEQPHSTGASTEGSTVSVAEERTTTTAADSDEDDDDSEVEASNANDSNNTGINAAVDGPLHVHPHAVAPTPKITASDEDLKDANKDNRLGGIFIGTVVVLIIAVVVIVVAAVFGGLVLMRR